METFLLVIIVVLAAMTIVWIYFNSRSNNKLIEKMELQTKKRLLLICLDSRIKTTAVLKEQCEKATKKSFDLLRQTVTLPKEYDIDELFHFLIEDDKWKNARECKEFIKNYRKFKRQEKTLSKLTKEQEIYDDKC